jgi:prevent-host-death family protein
MKTATARELRNRAASILETVSKGNEVVITKRGKSIAVLKPFVGKSEKEFSPVGFGLWKKRKDLKDVAGWIDKKREERFQQ